MLQQWKQVAVVTGAASGIGQASAIKFAQRGIAVMGSYHPQDPHDPETTIEAVQRHGGRCIMRAADVRLTEQMDNLAAAAVAEFGGIDYVVANAGLLRQSTLTSMSDDQWYEMIDVDLTGVMRTFRSCGRHIRDNGAMTAISSIAGGVYGWEGHTHYAAAKAGIPGLCKSVALEFAARGVRCNAIVPGLIETPQSLDAKNSLGPDGLKKAAANIPLKRVGRPEDIANLISFLSSEESSYLTGQAIIVDGGLTIRWPD